MANNDRTQSHDLRMLGWGGGGSFPEEFSTSLLAVLSPGRSQAVTSMRHSAAKAISGWWLACHAAKDCSRADCLPAPRQNS
jgi:hypothetical protein